MKKPVAIFDIDGTIFRSSLTIELNNMLIKYGVFPAIVQREIEEYHTKWLDRKGEYEEYLDTLVSVFDARIKGCLQSDVEKASRAVIEEQENRVYRYTRDLVKELRNTHTLVAISGSPVEIVRCFAEAWQFDHYAGTEHGIDAEGYYTGDVVRQPTKDKKGLLLSMAEEYGFALEQSVGVGDTETDVGFLEVVEDPICFNPNKTLYEIAQKRGWKVIVERKNVIYTLDE